MAGLLRYRAVARLYDVISAEPVYRVGRRLGIAQLELAPGDVVVDVGCGTGLSFPEVLARIGPAGRLLGIDASAAMLTRARRRVDVQGWTNVDLLEADLTTVSADAVIDRLGGPASAVLASYSLSLMPAWPTAWAVMKDVAGPGGRLAVVDMQPPVGVPAPLRWLATLVCLLGGSDLHARPWTAVESDCQQVTSASARGGHLQIRSGQVVRSDD